MSSELAITKDIVELYVLGLLPLSKRRLVEASFDESIQVQSWFLAFGELPDHVDDSVLESEEWMNLLARFADPQLQPAIEPEVNALKETPKSQSAGLFEGLKLLSEKLLSELATCNLPWPSPNQLERSVLMAGYAAHGGATERPETSPIKISFRFRESSGTRELTNAELSIPQTIDDLYESQLDGEQNSLLVEVSGPPLCEPVILRTLDGEIELQAWTGGHSKRQKFLVMAHELRELLGPELNCRLAMVDGSGRYAFGELADSRSGVL